MFIFHFVYTKQSFTELYIMKIKKFLLPICESVGTRVQFYDKIKLMLLLG